MNNLISKIAGYAIVGLTSKETAESWTEFISGSGRFIFFAYDLLFWHTIYSFIRSFMMSPSIMALFCLLVVSYWAMRKVSRVFQVFCFEIYAILSGRCILNELVARMMESDENK